MRSALLVSALYVLSNVTGFVQRAIVAGRFGGGEALDAFYAAFRLPDLLFNVLAGGALASAFIPLFSGHLAKGETALGWALARRVALGVGSAVGIAALLAASGAEVLVDAVIAPGFGPSQATLTAGLMRVMLISTVIFALSGLMMGVLQSHHHFLAPALAPVLYNVGIAAGAVLLGSMGIYGAAVGVVVGALMHLAVQLPTLARLIPRTSPALSASQSRQLRQDAQQVLQLMLPRVIGLAAVQVNFIVNTRLASAMETGAVTALNLAFAIMILPQAAIAQAISTVLFPAISAHAALGDRRAFTRALSQSMAVVLALSAPASVGLVVLGEPLIRLLFERGAFSAQNTAQTAFALQMFAVGLTAHAALEVVTRGFYALRDTLRPVMLAVVSMALNVALSVALSAAFARAGWMPFGGVALANSLATALETTVLWLLLQRREPALRAQVVLQALGRASAASALMGLALISWRALLGDGHTSTLFALPVGLAVYAAAAWSLGSAEMHWIAAQVHARVRHPLAELKK